VTGAAGAGAAAAAAAALLTPGQRGVDNPAHLFPGWATLPFGGPTTRGLRLKGSHRGLGLHRAHRFWVPASRGVRLKGGARGLGLTRTLDDVVQGSGWPGMVGHGRSLA
jgi:hypothetical protein